MKPEIQDNTWPLPKFYFSVYFESLGTRVAFQEVSGLDSEPQVPEYRAGNAQFSTFQMPGIVKTGNITLKKGVFKKDNDFWNWYNEIKMNTIKRATVTIHLLDESGSPTMTWALSNAWPTKITGTDLSSEGNEVAVEVIELAYEGLTISNA